MNLKRKNGKTLNKTGLIRNKLSGEIVNNHPASFTNSNGFDNIALYVSDENTRKSVRAAQLEAERWKAEANKLRLYIASPFPKELTE